MSYLQKKVDRLFAAWDKKNSPGCALGIIRYGKFLYARGYGMANLEHSVPITPDSVFDVASTSKQFVAACVAILARRKKLNLDDEIQKHLVEMPKYRYPVTIRHLIHHTSGVRDYLTLMDLAGLRYENEYSDEEITGLIARQKRLNFRPGSAYLYSNSGYLLLGEIVKRVSGLTLRQFAHQQLFAPLGMSSTHFHDDFTEIVKNRAAGYAAGKDGPRISISIFDVAGDGGLNTTLNDLLLWDRNFYANCLGGFGGKLIEELTTPGRLNSGKELNYAFGLFTEPYRGLKTVHHGGSWLGYRCELVRFPEQKFSVICLSNTEAMNAISLARGVADLYLTEEFTQPKTQAADGPGRASTGKIKCKTGIYLNPKTGVTAVLSNKGGYKLELSGNTHQLNRVSAVSLREKNGAVQLDLEGEAKFTYSPRGGQKAVYSWLPTYNITAARSRRLAGNYYCDELNTSYGITAKGKTLKLNRKGAPEETLVPLKKDLFKAGPYITLRFKAGSFSLVAGRVKNIRFSKR